MVSGNVSSGIIALELAISGSDETFGRDDARSSFQVATAALSAKAGGLCDAMHAVPPWRGELPAAADRATLLENTGVGDERRAA